MGTSRKMARNYLRKHVGNRGLKDAWKSYQQSKKDKEESEKNGEAETN